MNLQPRSWRRYIWVPVVLMALSVLAVGARDIADELSNRTSRQRTTERRIQQWSRHVILHVEEERDQWQEVAEEQPENLIRTCIHIQETSKPFKP